MYVYVKEGISDSSKGGGAWKEGDQSKHTKASDEKEERSMAHTLLWK